MKIQAAANQHASLEQKMLQMGAEPTEMLLAPLNRQNASRQRAGPPPAAPPSGPRGRGSGNRGGRRGASHPIRQPRQPPRQPAQPITGQLAQTAATWSRFVDNIEKEDEKLENLARTAAANHTASGTVRDVYKPTTLVDGQRTSGGDKVVKHVPLTYGQVAAAPNSAQPALIPDLASEISELSLANGPAHAQGRVPSNLLGANGHCSHNAGITGLGQPNNGPRKTGGQTQGPPVQQPQQQQQQQLIQEPSIEQPHLLIDIDLLDDPIPASLACEKPLLGYDQQPLLGPLSSVLSPPPSLEAPSTAHSTLSPEVSAPSENDEEELLIEL